MGLRNWRRVLLALIDAFLWCARWPGNMELKLAVNYDGWAAKARERHDEKEARRCEREAARLRRDGQRFLNDFPEFRFAVLLLCILGGLGYCLFSS